MLLDGLIFVINLVPKFVIPSHRQLLIPSHPPPQTRTTPLPTPKTHLHNITPSFNASCNPPPASFSPVMLSIHSAASFSRAGSCFAAAFAAVVGSIKEE